MPFPVAGALAGGSLIARGLGSLFGARARRRQEKQATGALVRSRGREEELRSARAGAGANLLRGLASGSALQGRIRNPFGGLTDEMLAPILRRQSEQELKSQITPAEQQAAFGQQRPSFLQGLMGGVSDFLGRAKPELFSGGGAGAGAGLPGGVRTGVLPNVPLVGGDQPAQTIDWDAIMAAQQRPR